MFFDGCGQFGERVRVHLRARLAGIRDDIRDRHLEQAGRTGGRCIIHAA